MSKDRNDIAEVIFTIIAFTITISAWILLFIEDSQSHLTTKIVTTTIVERIYDPNWHWLALPMLVIGFIGAIICAVIMGVRYHILN